MAKQHLPKRLYRAPAGVTDLLAINSLRHSFNYCTTIFVKFITHQTENSWEKMKVIFNEKNSRRF